MKKFLALAACAMAMTIPAWADEPASSCQVTMTVSDAYDTTGTVKADKITAEVSLADGVYTIDNFLGTGQPLSFTLPEDPENLKYIYGGVGFTGDNLDLEDGVYWMWNPANEDDSLAFDLNNYNGEDVTLYWPGIEPDYSSYYHRTEEGKKPWYLTISIDALNADNEWYYLDVTFWMPELVEPTPETEGNTTAFVENDDEGFFYQNYSCDVTVNEDGSVTATNFMNGGLDVTFTFDKSQLSEAWDYVYMATVNGTNAGFWLKDADGNYPTYKLTKEDGTEVSFQKTYIYPSYSYVQRLDEAEEYNTYVEFCTYAKISDEEDPYLYVGFYMNLDYPTAQEPVVVDFADALMGSMPSNEEPIDLEEYELGAGYLNIAFGGELTLAEGAEAPVTISYNGEEVASVTLNEDNLVVLGNDDPTEYSEGDDVDPGMTAGVTYTMVELDFNMALTEAGEYTVSFPEGILAYANGDLLGAGTVNYTIEAKTPVVEGNTTAFVENDDEGFFYQDYRCDVTVNEDGSVTATNFMNGGLDVTFTFDKSQLSEAWDYVYMATVNGTNAGFWLKDADGNYPTYKLTKEDGTEVSFQKTYIYPTYSYVQRLDEAEEYNTYVEFCTYAKISDEEDPYLYVGFYMNLDYPTAQEPVVVDFADALMGSMPDNEEPIDLEEYELGAGYLNIAFGGELTLAEGAEAPVTISYNGEEVASVTLREDNLVVLGNDDPTEYSEGDDVDPGMTAGVTYTMVELDFDMALTEAGEYTVSFPEGILAYANGDLLGAGTVTYTIEAKTPVVVVPETSGNTIAWIETPWSNGEYYGYYTDVTKNEPGNYTTTNFMYSGASVTVTFDVDELKNSKNGYVGFTSINGNDEEYPFLLDTEGNNVDCYAYNVDGTMATIESPYFFNWDDYSYVELYSEEEAAEYGYNAYICFLIRGWTPEGKSSDYYEVWFDVNIDLTETGIQNVTIGGDAEYYDLQGVRVANPEKGIYIMRQGNKTVKVAK